jgi:ubiquinone/menaquinone biosynthesis C-methylase UbiE
MSQIYLYVNAKDWAPMNNLKISDKDRSINQPMEQMVSTYDAYMRKMTFGREKILRQKTVELALIQPGDSVLEVGCGTGSLTLAAKRQAGPSGKVTGIDVLPGMVDYSRQKAAQAGADITFQLGTINDIPFSENSFDAALCSFMIFHMSEDTWRQGIVDIYRVLKPQGRLLVVDLAMPSQPLQQAIARRVIFPGGLAHDLHELLPAMRETSFAEIEYAPVRFSIFGLSIIAYVRGRAQKK